MNHRFQEEKSQNTNHPIIKERENNSAKQNTRNSLNLKFRIPKGKASGIMRIINYLHTKFDTIEMNVNIESGSITETEFQDRIEEGFRQLGIMI